MLYQTALGLFALLLFIPASLSQLRETPSCSFAACSPDSGDILIGRGDRLEASSTCGQDKPENYSAPCSSSSSSSVVGPFFGRQCTYTCDANTSSRAHPPGNVAQPFSSADVNQSWWQSALGAGPVVLEVKLEALFYFTHFVMTFKSPRPLSLVVEISRDFGKTYRKIQFYADDCRAKFNMEDREVPRDIRDTICSSSHFDQRSSQEIVYRALHPELVIENLYSRQVTRSITLTNLRLTMEGFDLLTAVPPGAPSVRPYQHFSLYSLVLRGWCFCNGHARECDPLQGVPQQPGMVNPVCRCIHHTMGQNCELCLPLYNNQPWKAGNPRTGAANSCQKCQCYGHASSCVYDLTARGGVCQDCTHNTEGVNCEQCRPFYYRNTSTLRNDPDVCLECPCDTGGSERGGDCIRDDDPSRGHRSGQCLCKRNVEATPPHSTHCDSCLSGYYNLSAANPDGCQACLCSPSGSLNGECHQETGQCFCKEGVAGLKCDQCKSERCCLRGSNPEGCEPCNCDVGGSYSAVCDVTSGQCPCRPNIMGLKCDAIPEGSFVDVVVTVEPEYNVNTNTTTIINIGGDLDGPKRGPYVVVVPTNSSLDISLDPDGTSGYTIVVYYRPPNGTNVEDVSFDVIVTSTSPVNPGDFPGGPCSSSGGGSPTMMTSSTSWSFRVQGRESDFNAAAADGGLYSVAVGLVCVGGGANYTVTISNPGPGPTGSPTSDVLIDKIDLVPDVRTFNSTPPTVTVDCSEPNRPPICNPDDPAATNVSMEISVPCDSPIAISMGLLDSPACKDLVKVGVIINNGSKPCDCDKEGSMGEECGEVEGACSCKPGFSGRRCDRCFPFFKMPDPGQCLDCKCDLSGSRYEQCHINTGQCDCLPGVTGLACDRCLDDHYDFGNPAGCLRCGCDSVGALGVTCDGDGACACRNGVTGDKCDVCAVDHYNHSSSGCSPCDCDPEGSLVTGSCDVVTGQCECRVGVVGRRCNQCRDSPLGPSQSISRFCIGCFCNGFSEQCGPGAGPGAGPGVWYQAMVGYTFLSEDEGLNWTSNTDREWKGSYLEFSTDFPSTETTLEIHYPRDAIGMKRAAYGHFLVMTLRLSQPPGVPLENSPSLVMETRLNPYSTLKLAAELTPLSDGLQSIVLPLLAESFQRVDFISFPASEADVRKTLTDISSMKLVVDFEADSVARQPKLQLHSFHFNYAVDDPAHSHAATPPTPAQFVESCECPESRFGQFCQFCSEGFTRDPPLGGQFAKCVHCFCFGHAPTCHPETGVCLNCSAHTAGDFCEGCAEGHFRNHTSNSCEECRCPGGPGARNQFTQSCRTTPQDQVLCDCPRGFLQPDCARCAPGFYGDPTQPDGNCRRCDCHGNSVGGAGGGARCDSVRGVCFCRDPYVGDSCERCKDGYYGDATQQMCSVCDCDGTGTVPGSACHPASGQCQCRPSVAGQRCDRCQPASYGLRTLGACPGCGCCPAGSASLNCTQDNGICTCLDGYVGPKCCDCDDGYHDNGMGECVECNCPVEAGSSLSSVCDKTTGQCLCKEGVAGVKCDRCLANTSGLLPLCEPCDECYDRWLDRLSTFVEDVRVVVSIARTLNVTLVPVEDLFGLIRDIASTINRSRIDAALYTRTDRYTSRLTSAVRSLLQLAEDYALRLDRAGQREAGLVVEAGLRNATLVALRGRALGLNRSYPVLECERFGRLVEEGLLRSNEAHRLVTGAVGSLTSNASGLLRDYRLKKSQRVYSEIRDDLETGIIDVQNLYRDYRSLLEEATDRLCGGEWEGECGECGGAACGFCSTDRRCGGLHGNASWALDSATRARQHGQLLVANLTVTIATLRDLGAETVGLATNVSFTGEFVLELKERVEETRDLVSFILRVLGSITAFLQDVDPETIAQLERDTLAYQLSRTPEEVSDLLTDLRSTLDAFPPWVEANNSALLGTARTTEQTATAANTLAFSVGGRAGTVRDELFQLVGRSSTVKEELELSRQHMMEATDKSELSNTLLVSVEGNLNRTETILDRLEVHLADVERRFSDNEDRLRSVQTSTAGTAELAAGTQGLSDDLDRAFDSLEASTQESASRTTEDRRKTSALRSRIEEVNRRSLRQLTEVEDMLRRQGQLRHRQEQVKDDVTHIRIEMEELSLEINRNSFKNTGCQRFGGAG